MFVKRYVLKLILLLVTPEKNKDYKQFFFF